MVEEKIEASIWKNLHELYEKNTVANRVFLMKKLYNHKIKEGIFIAEHLNEFNVITNQLASIKITLDDEIRPIWLMCSMPDSWENSIVDFSTLAPVVTLKFDNVSSSLMNEEMWHKSISENQGGEALALSDHVRKI